MKDDISHDGTPYLTCPFCSETDFDKIGLKFHLQRGHCDVFNDTPVPHWHVAKYVDEKLTDECNACGRDLRDSIHRPPI
jgi:hypothetical protein